MPTASYHLERDLGITAFNGNKKLSEQFNNSIASAQALLPSLFGWCKYKGWTDAEIMSLYFGEAGWHHCFWAGQKNDYASATPSPAVNIEVGAGRYMVTTILPHACGVYRGQGSRFHDGDGTHSYGSTEWMIDHANWKTKYFTDRVIMRSANWNGTGDGAWVHNVVIEHMHFNGARRSRWLVNDNIMSAGLAIQDMGEAAYVNHCYFEDFEKDGLVFMGGTPATAICCSFFNTNRFGCAVLGGGSVLLIRPSGDENGVALVGNDGKSYGRDPRCALTIIGFKHETGTSDAFRPYKGSALIDYTGWLTLDIRGGTYAASWLTPYCLIRVKPTVNKSSITVSGIQFFGNTPKVLLYDEVANKEHSFVGNAWHNAIAAWSWHQDYPSMKTDWVTIPTSTGKGGRLQHLGTDGAASWDVAKLYDPTGGGGTTPPINPPTPVDPVPPTPVDPVPPAPPTTVTPARFTFSSGTAASLVSAEGLRMTQVAGTASVASGKLTVLNNPAGASASWTCNLVAKTVTLLNFVPSAAVGGQYIFSTSAKKGIVITDGGGIADNTGGTDRMLYPAGTLVAGRNVASLVLTMNAPTNFVRFGATESAGNCFKASVDEVRIA